MVVNYDANRNFDVGRHVTILISSLCDHNDSHIRVNGTKTIDGAGADAAAQTDEERNK